MPVTSPFPAVWVSDVDASDPSAGIHCGEINERWGRLAAGVARRLIRIAEL